MEESALGLMNINELTADILTNVTLLKEIVADLENMEVSVTEILTKLDQKMGYSAKEVEHNIRMRFAQALKEVIELMSFMAQGNEIEEEK